MLKRLLLRGWPVLLVAVSLGAAAGYALEFGGEPEYNATATLYVAPPTSSNAMDAVMGDQYAASRTQLYLELAQSDELARRVAAQIQSSDAPSELATKITATGSHDAPLLILDATGSTPDEALTLVNAYVDQFPEYAKTVEQGSGMREGPVLVNATGAQVVGATTGGFKSWLRAAVPALILGGLALVLIIWFRLRHPNAHNVPALRKAAPGAFVERVSTDPDDLQRLHTLLFAAPNSARTIVFAGVRTRDALEPFAADFSHSLVRAGISVRHVIWADLDDFSKRHNATEVVVVDGPALLDNTQRIPTLATHAAAAVIVAMGKKSSVDDVVELSKLLELNDLEVKGILTITAGAHGIGAGRSNKMAGRNGVNPWPKIDVLEDAAQGRSGRRAT